MHKTRRTLVYPLSVAHSLYFSPKLLPVYTEFLFLHIVSHHAYHCDILRGTVPWGEPAFHVCSYYCNGDEC